jgi:HlyD family secretion protein
MFRRIYLVGYGKMAKYKLPIIIAAVIATVGLGGWAILKGRHQTEFRTASVERGDIDATISATGTSNAVVSVQVGSQVSGNIKALYADFNTKVTKGQLVALIDPEIFQAKVNQAQANLDNARIAVLNYGAQVTKAAADVASAQANLQVAKENVAKAKVAVVDSQSKLKRRIDLVQQGILAKEDGETAQATYDSNVSGEDAANAQVTAAESSLNAARAQEQVAKAQVAAAQTQVKQSEATLRQASIDLEHTRILAPVDGTVVARRMDVGQTVAASFQAPTIFEIAQDLTKMQVDTNVDEADIGRLQVGQNAAFTVDAYPGQTFHGRVTEIRKAPINVQNVITYDAVIAVANPDLKLFPGMTANVKVLVDHRSGVLKIPNAALRFRPANSAPVANQKNPGSRRQAARGQTVWVMGDNGKPKPVQVTLGITDGAMSEVVAGDLKEGQEVIIGMAAEAGTSQPRGGPTVGGPTGGGRRGPGF